MLLCCYIINLCTPSTLLPLSLPLPFYPSSICLPFTLRPFYPSSSLRLRLRLPLITAALTLILLPFYPSTLNPLPLSLPFTSYPLPFTLSLNNDCHPYPYPYTLITTLPLHPSTLLPFIIAFRFCFCLYNTYISFSTNLII